MQPCKEGISRPGINGRCDPDICPETDTAVNGNHQSGMQAGTTAFSQRFPFPVYNPQHECCSAITDKSAEWEPAEEERRVLARLSARLAASAEIDEMIEAVREETDRLLGWDAHYFAVWQREEDRFRVLYLVDTIEGRRQMFPPETWQASEIADPVRPLLAGEAVLLNRDPGASEPALDRFGDVSRPSASLMFAPVRSGNAVIGILSAQSYTAGRYGPRDLRGLQAVADVVAPALERLNAEEARRESEGRFSVVFQASPVAIAIARISDNRLVDVNEAWSRMTGFSREEAVGRTAAELGVWADPGARDRVLDELRGTGAVREFECEVRHKAGGTVCVLLSAAQIELMREPCVLFMAQDITGLKRVERELRDLSARHEAVLSAVPDIIMEVDEHKVYRWANWAGFEFFGDDVLGKEACAYFVDDRDTYARVEPLFLGNSDVVYAENWQRRRDGEKRLLAWWCRPLKNERGEVIGALSSAHDITDQRRAEEEARQRQAELAHISRLHMVGEMASSLAHELNQPLTAILCGMELCQQMIRDGTADPVEVNDTMASVAGAADLAGRILRRLRRFACRHEPQRSPTNINALVREAAEIAAPDARRHGVTVRLQLADSEPLVPVDCVQIEQVILNLARNAIEAMDEQATDPRELRIATSENGTDAIEVAVSDTGPGMSDEALARLFVPFYTTKPEGMGIGLSISRSIVEAHGGSLRAVRNPDRGMTFRFTLPLVRGCTDDTRRTDSVHCG